MGKVRFMESEWIEISNKKDLVSISKLLNRAGYRLDNGKRYTRSRTQLEYLLTRGPVFYINPFLGELSFTGRNGCDFLKSNHVINY